MLTDKTYHPILSFLDNNYITATLPSVMTGSVLGYSLGGFPGAAIGGVTAGIGTIIEEFLVQHEIISARYFSWSITSTSFSFNIISQFGLNHAVVTGTSLVSGAVGGTIIASGHSPELGKLSYPLTTIITGAAIYGIEGALLGIMSNIIDSSYETNNIPYFLKGEEQYIHDTPYFLKGENTLLIPLATHFYLVPLYMGL